MGSVASIFLLIPRILIAMLIFTCLMSESERKYSVTLIHSDAIYMILCALHAFGTVVPVTVVDPAVQGTATCTVCSSYTALDGIRTRTRRASSRR